VSANVSPNVSTNVIICMTPNDTQK